MTVTESEEIPPRAERAAQCLERVRELLLRIRAAREVRLEGINGVAPRHRHSAVNLVDYTAVRSEDVRDLQIQLAGLGVSSLGRMESGVAEHLTAVARTLAAVAGLPDPQLPDLDPGLLPGEDLRPGPVTLARNTVRLVGQAPEGRATRIMVTMPSEAAQDPALVSRMVAAGTDVARINCAHDGPQEWSSMIEHLRAAASDLGTDVRIAMDLAGPKVRTGPVEPGPRVEKIKPERDATGHVIRPARLWLGAQHSEDVPAVAVAPEQWLAERTVGERLQLRDARDSGRTLRVVETHDDAVLVEFSKTVYFATGLVLRTRDGSEATLGELPETEQYLRVATGDTLRLLNSTEPVQVGGPSPVRIGCTLPEAFQDAAAGQRVWLDDGKIGGVIRHVHAGHMDVEITHASPAGSKLKAEKGINFPDTDLRIPALTAKDREDLAFVVQHADIVNMSFVRSAQDVADLLAELQALGADSVDITLKIETVGGFEHLPMVLLEAMRWQDSGVMIARGDLAVETGFERMAEVQQEILWLCEAAHVPVIWATQVLETLAKKGLPSRAEITDAAQGQQAECVMLNKGPFVVEAIRTLSSVLERMSGHASKKTDLLRRLNAWEDFVRGPAPERAVCRARGLCALGVRGARARAPPRALCHSESDVLGLGRRAAPIRLEEWTQMRVNPLNKAFDEHGQPSPGVEKFLNHALRVQRPWVVKMIKHMRRQHPDETPAQLAKRARKLYVRSVTAGGGAVGATAAIQGIGTLTSFGLSSVAVTGYLEATALYAQAVAELHGVEPKDEDQNRTMVMALMLGDDGQALMGQLLTSSSTSKSISNKWGLMMGKSGSNAKFFDVGRSIRSMFVKRFIARQSGAMLGRALPFGIGAFVGGGANLAMARQVIKSADEAFGEFPEQFPPNLTLGDRAEAFEGGTTASQQEALETATTGRE